MMALSTQFSFVSLLSLMVIVILQPLMLQTSADVHVSANPAQIEAGSPSLDVNCTFSINTSSAMAEIVSLTVSRENGTELASITTFSDHQVNVISSEEITADGVINPGGQSYIHLHWGYPTDTQTGTYQCVARGLDLLGQTVIVSNTTVVTMGQVDIASVMDKVRELEAYMEQKLAGVDNYTKQLEAKVEKMDNYTQELEEKVTRMENYTRELENRLLMNEDYMKNLEQNVSDISSIPNTLLTTVEDRLIPLNFEYPPFIHHNRTYLLSKSPFFNFNDTLSICKTIGGQMAEMNDIDEYDAVRNYLNNFIGFGFVFIGGTDEGHNGTWVLPSTNEEMPVVDWYSYTEPPSDSKYHCLSLNTAHDWRMLAYSCDFEMTSQAYRYLCELPREIVFYMY